MLTGGGTVIGDVSGFGTVQPGDGVGTLTINGDYTQGAGGKLDLEIAGADPTQYDRLVVTGAATLQGGLIAASYVDGFTPGLTDTFDVLTYASASGDFQGVTTTGGPDLQHTLGPTSVTLSQIPQIGNWDGGGDGVSWHDPENWVGDVLPGPTDDVVIDVVGDLTVVFTADAGAQTIASLSSPESLTISGGELTVADFDVEVLEFTGGSLKISSGRAGELSWSGGSLVGINGDPERDVFLFENVNLSGSASRASGISLRVDVAGALVYSGDAGADLQLDAGSQLVVAAGATLDISGIGFVTRSADERIVNRGTIRLAAGADWFVGAKIENTGTLDIAANAIVRDETPAGRPEPSLMLNSGTINITSGAQVSLTVLSQSDLLDIQDGTVELDEMFSAANGRWVVGPLGTLKLGRSNLAPDEPDHRLGSDSSLTVRGTLIVENTSLETLEPLLIDGGRLQVTGGFLPQLADRFTVFVAEQPPITGIPEAVDQFPPSQPLGVDTENDSNILIYTPAANFSGFDIFRYAATDSVLSNAAFVQIDVLPVNDPPIAQDMSLATAIDTSIRIELAVTDPDGDPLTFDAFQGEHDTVTNNSDGSVTYTPDAGFEGIDSFDYSADDPSGTTGIATVTVSVQATTPEEDAASAGSQAREGVPEVIRLLKQAGETFNRDAQDIGPQPETPGLPDDAGDQLKATEKLNGFEETPIPNDPVNSADDLKRFFEEAIRDALNNDLFPESTFAIDFIQQGVGGLPPAPTANDIIQARFTASLANLTLYCRSVSLSLA